MKYDLANQKQATEAFEYLTYLVGKGSFVDITKKSPKRTLSQNSYLYLIITDFGLHFGYSIEEAKYLYKEINAEIYAYVKKGRTFYRSSADLNKEEMAKTIDKFMRKSSEAGHDLPPADDPEWLRWAANEAEKSHYL